MPPRRRPWPALQIDVGGEEPGGGGFALAENAKAKRNVDAARSHRASTSTSASSTSSSIRASYAEAARRSTTNINYNNRSSVCASAMLSFCDDGRLKPSAFGAAIRAGRETRPSEFSVSAVATTEAGGGGGGGIAAQAPAPPPPQQQQTSSARVRDDGVTGREPEAAAVAAAWHQLTENDVLLGGVLGRGTSSVVHSGTILSTGEKVAVKRLSAADGASARAIVNELRALAPRSSSSSSNSSSAIPSSSFYSSSSSSSGLVELRGAYAEAGGARLAVVLELMPGGSLADAIARRGALVRRRARKREKEAERERKKKIMEQGGEEAAVEAEKAPSTSSSSFSSFVPLGLPERAVARVALGALTGLARIRELGLVHRDVKPANILLDGDVVALCEKEEAEEGEKKRAGGCGDDDDDKTDPFSSLNAKVADFGLASAGANGGGGAGFDGSIAACTTFVGTVTYMSPERATSANPADGGGGNGSSNDGSGDGGGGGEGGGVGSGSKGSRNQTKAGYSAPADVWALGLTLMEAATGIYPYALVSSRGNGNGGAETGARGNSNNDDNSNNSNPAAAAARAIAAAGPLALLMQVVTDPAPVLPDDGAGFTAAFSDFLARCLEKDPRRRATARELLSHPWVVSGGRGEKVRRSCSAVLARPLPPPAAPVAPPSSSSVLARAPLRLPSASFSSSSSRSSPSASLEGPPSPPPDAAAAAASVAASSPRGARGASSSPPPPPPPLLTAAAATVFSSPERASSPPTLPRGGGENAAGGVGVGGVGRVGAGVQARATTQALPLPPRLPFSSPSRTATITTTTATAADARALSLATLRARFSSNSQPGARRAALAPLYDRGVSLRLEGRPAVLRGARAALDAWDAEASGRESLGATGEAEVLGVDVLAVGGLAAREAVEGAVAGGVEEAVEGGGGEEAAEKGGKGKGKGDGDDASASSCPSCCFLVHVTGTVPGPALGPFAAAAAAAAAGGGRGFGGGGRRTAFAEALVVVCSGRGRGGTAEKSDAAPAAACSSSSLPFGGLRITSHTFRTLR